MMKKSYVTEISKGKRNPMNILLTGSTGLLGSHLLEQLLSAKNQIHCFVRSVPKRSFLGQNEISASPQVHLIEGDLFSTLGSQTFDVVIHAAAMTSVDQNLRDEIWKVNFEGTKSLFSQLKGRFEKWVQISSIATLCDGTKPLVTELSQGKFRPTAYAESKYHAEKFIQAEAPQALIIHPCYLLGAWDAKPSSGALLHALKWGKLEGFVNVEKNFVAARDVATGVIQALNKDAQGSYILGNENLWLKDFFQMCAQELNLTETPAEITSSEMKSDWIKEFCTASSVDWSKAQRDFSYNPQLTTAEALKETMDYFEKFRMLKRSPKLHP
jgi:nucleoside-diphosphate-sugar epimerase